MKRMCIVVAIISLAGAVAVLANSLPSPKHLEQGIGPGVTTVENRAQEYLFRGDMTAETGLGCSNTTGNSGGPNDIAQGVTATLTPPMGIIQATYNIFTQNGYITQLAFRAWAGAGPPGATIASQALTAAQYSLGTHTVAIAPYIPLANQQFFFGFNQPQTNAGMRWGLDTSSGPSGTAYIRAPSCGLAAWGTLDSIGYPGAWVMRVLIDDTVPVELQSFNVE